MSQRRRALLPRDEHPHPGGAHRHRSGDRDRSGQGAATDRRRRATLLQRRSSHGATPSSSASTRRTRRGSSCPTRAPSSSTRNRAGPGSGSTAASGRLGHQPVLRQPGRQAGRVGAGSERGHRAGYATPSSPSRSRVSSPRSRRT